MGNAPVIAPEAAPQAGGPKRCAYSHRETERQADQDSLQQFLQYSLQ
jgi:hypothetical protein